VGKDDQPIAGISEEDQNIFWEQMLAEEEGVILNSNSTPRKARSVHLQTERSM
jgi:hypothetical protein